MLGGFFGWAAVLAAQNYSFTYVSRARNSGSLFRHFKAAIFSNGIWIASNMIMLGPMFDYLTGKHGYVQQAIAGTVYTVSTVAGSLAAHYVSKKTEKGKDAVGASDRYVQISKAEWADVQSRLLRVPSAEDFARVRELAEQSYDVMCGLIPDSGITASKANPNGGLEVTGRVPLG